MVLTSESDAYSNNLTTDLRLLPLTARKDTDIFLAVIQAQTMLDIILE
jgi:hypothetical protein